MKPGDIVQYKREELAINGPGCYKHIGGCRDFEGKRAWWQSYRDGKEDPSWNLTGKDIFMIIEKGPEVYGGRTSMQEEYSSSAPKSKVIMYSPRLQKYFMDDESCLKLVQKFRST